MDADQDRNQLPFNLDDMDVHALDVEDLPIDIEDDVAPVNALNKSFDNITLGDYTNTWIFGRNEDQIILPVILTFIGFVVLISNLSVILTVLGIKRMRTGPNLMILNIAIADLVFIGFSIPTSIINHAVRDQSIVLSVNFCRFVHYVIFVTVYVAIYTLVIICVFRICSEALATRFSSLLSCTNAILSCAVIWCAFLISHINLLIQEDAVLFHEPFICIHSDVLDDPAKQRTLWITFLTCAFLLPLIIICSLSGVILHPGRRRGSPATVSADRAESRYRRELTVVTMAIMVLRTLCWLPIQIFFMLDVFAMADITIMYRKAEMIGMCCALLGASLNILVYRTISADFKLAFQELSMCSKQREEQQTYKDDASDMNETILSILTDSSNPVDVGQHYSNHMVATRRDY